MPPLLPRPVLLASPLNVTVKLGAVVIPQFARGPTPAGVIVATRVKRSTAQLPLPPESCRSRSRVVALTSWLRPLRWLLWVLADAAAGMMPARPIPATAVTPRATWITRAFMIYFTFLVGPPREAAGSGGRAPL